MPNVKTSDFYTLTHYSKIKKDIVVKKEQKRLKSVKKPAVECFRCMFKFFFVVVVVFFFLLFSTNVSINL